jgi:DNA-binding SARP family transcriptional activator/predicted negative regulator of RcsB-dependent stress response
MTRLTLNLLGPPRFDRDGAPRTLMQAKGIALLLYLAMSRNAQPRERLVDLLWPESLPQAARKNMRNILWAIGEVLGDDVLEHSSGTLRLAPGVLVDVHGLEDGLLLLESGSVTALETAAEAYRGPLADGLALHEAPEFELWLASERERLAGIYLRLLERIIALHRGAGAWQQVIVHAQRALAADPLREPIHLALIEGYVRLGQRVQAAQQYAALTDILKRELDVAPLPETTARYEALLADVSLPPVEMPPRPARRAQPAIPFIGREAELAALDHERSRAAQGEARVVLIAGDLGIGKTQLWKTWVDTRAGDAIVLTTHTLETAEPVPFGPLLTLFRQPGPAQAVIRPPSPLAPIWLAELTRLLPELATFWPELPAPLALSPAEERARLLQALTEAFRLLATPLLVVIVDDLHWADPSMLDWLLYFADQLCDAPLLLAGTYRPQDASERLLTLAAAWQRQGRLHHLPLAQLTDDEAEKLLTVLGTPDSSNPAADVIHQSGGNPYFLIELLRARSDAASDGLAALVRARLHAIVPAHAMQVLQAAAVLGDDTTFPLLQVTSGRGEEELLDALDALTTAAVLRTEEQIYRFVHPLVATIVRADLGSARRAFLHRRAAQALERVHAPHVEQVAGLLTEHYAAAGELRRAAQYAEQAAEQAMKVGAFVEAASYARRTLEWEPTPKRQLLLGEVLLPSRGPNEAQQPLEAALRGFEHAGDVIGVTRACLALALMAVGASQVDAARRWLAHPSIQQVDLLEPALCVQALLLAASVERQSQAYDTALVLLGQASQLAWQHQLTGLDAQITFERGNLLANRGDLSAAVAAFAEALRMAETSSNPVFMTMARNNLAYHTLLLGDVEQAQHHVDVAVELAERYALGFLWQYVWSTAGEIALARKELDSAEAAFEHAFEVARAWGNRVHMANVHVNQALVAQARSRLDRAREHLEAARAVFGDVGDPVVRNKIARVSAELGAQASTKG